MTRRDTVDRARRRIPILASVTTRLGLAFGGGLDPRVWADRHAAGEVPDAQPYGLDRLAGHGFEITDRQIAERAGGHRHLGRRVPRRLGGGVDWGLALAAAPAADVVLGWDERVGAPLALRHGDRLPVVSGVIWLTDRPRATDQATAIALRRAARLVVLSSAQVTPLALLTGRAPETIVPVPFGVDADFFAPRDDDADPDLVVALGNDRDRDWPATVAAFRAVRRARPSARMVLVSSTVPRGAEDAVAGVRVVPHLDHRGVRDLLARAAVQLTLTRQNRHLSGITAALEALAMGTPVVLSRRPGLGDYAAWGDGVVAVGSPQEAARGVLAILADADERQARGTAGRAAVVDQFSTARMAHRLAAVLQDAGSAAS